jgi:hypothetical protein
MSGISKPAGVALLGSSYRDPAGFMFELDGKLYRQVNMVFRENYDHFMTSGLYQALVGDGLLVSHEELEKDLAGTPGWFKTLIPEKIKVISYPYEWSFDMLKDAAMLTLNLLKRSLSFGMILKDATPFNIQWRHGKPVLIDTLSFEKYDPNLPWIAYRQFCECFLSPLVLMHYSRQPLQNLQLAYPDGIPLQMTRSLLPWKSRFSLHTYLHLHLHAKYAAKPVENGGKPVPIFSEKKLSRLIESMMTLVTSLKLRGKPSTWENYYSEADTRDDYIEPKKKIIDAWIGTLGHVETALDAGANEGKFTDLLVQKGIEVVATDFDHAAINKLYRSYKAENKPGMLPLVMDVSNPSPAIGVNNKERTSFIERVNVDLCMALALIHHLAIGKNIPFIKLAHFFASMGNWLIIEFVPKEDPKIQEMLRQKTDIYSEYTEAGFVKAFEQYFILHQKQTIGGSKRVLYLFKKNG